MQTLTQVPRKRAYLLATGQTTSYGSGTGVDDGALQKGIVKVYTVLSTGQYSGTTNITINSKTDAHSNNCVVSNTGLMWSRYASASVGPNSNGTLPWTTTGSGATAEGIFPYCAAANAGTLSGYTDWRIPNELELVSLQDMETPTAVPDVTAFPAWPSALSYFWSSTTYPVTTTYAMRVDFTNGNKAPILKTAAHYCALVRGPK